MKTAEEFADWCESLEGRAVYWYGTFIQKCTNDLYKRKCVQYPEHYTAKRAPRYEIDIAQNRVCCDCVGMIKGFMWGASDGKVVYASNGIPDKSAEGLEKWAISQGAEHGTIKTLPEERGVILVKTGHTGTYVGNGYAVEAKGFDDDIVKTRIADRGWLRWYKMPGLKYKEKPEVNTRCPYLEPQRNIKKGMTGAGVMWVQWMLAACDYQRRNVDGVDGIFGKNTDWDVRYFQACNDLEVDGIVGVLTREKLKEVLKR